MNPAKSEQAGAPVRIAAPAGAACLAARGRTLVLTSLRARANPLAAHIMGNVGGRRAGAACLAMFVLLACLLSAMPARAGLSDTLPAGTFLLDSSISLSQLHSRYNDQGQKTTLIDELKLYEPGSGLQGTLIPRAEVNYLILINQLQYGVTDSLSVGLGIPVVLNTSVDLNMEWIPGDYQNYLGRRYSEDDFWQWAGSMGQPRPRDWQGNRGTLSDIILGVRWRFSDHLPWLRRQQLRTVLTVMGALPTGSPPPPEELAGAGTTMWDLHSQGELCFHLALERTFFERINLGVDTFYEIFFRHSYTTPTGSKNPLLLTLAPYVGPSYSIDPGDFAGVALQIEGTIIYGPALATWLSGHDAARAEKLPPLLSASVMYKYTHVAGSDWQSQSAIWDWEKEKLWLPGHKNTLWFRVTVSLLRLGIPLRLYFAYRNQSWLGGRNVRAADVFAGGLQLPARFW